MSSSHDIIRLHVQSDNGDEGAASQPRGPGKVSPPKARNSKEAPARGGGRARKISAEQNGADVEYQAPAPLQHFSQSPPGHMQPYAPIQQPQFASAPGYNAQYQYGQHVTPPPNMNANQMSVCSPHRQSMHIGLQPHGGYGYGGPGESGANDAGYGVSPRVYIQRQSAAGAGNYGSPARQVSSHTCQGTH